MIYFAVRGMTLLESVEMSVMYFLLKTATTYREKQTIRNLK